MQISAQSPHSPKAVGRRWIGCSVVAIALIAGAAWAVWYFVLDDDPIPSLEKMLNESGPPIGATREDVQIWLDQRGIWNAREVNVSDNGGYPAQTSPLGFGNLDPRIKGGYVLGTMRVPHRWGWMRWVFLYFFFDADGRLVQHVVKAWDSPGP